MEREPKRGTSVSSLPEEMLWVILSGFAGEYRSAWAPVCRRWRAVADAAAAAAAATAATAASVWTLAERGHSALLHEWWGRRHGRTFVSCDSLALCSARGGSWATCDWVRALADDERKVEAEARALAIAEVKATAADGVTKLNGMIRAKIRAAPGSDNVNKYLVNDITVAEIAATAVSAMATEAATAEAKTRLAATVRSLYEAEAESEADSTDNDDSDEDETRTGLISAEAEVEAAINAVTGNTAEVGAKDDFEHVLDEIESAVNESAITASIEAKVVVEAAVAEATRVATAVIESAAGAGHRGESSEEESGSSEEESGSGEDEGEHRGSGSGYWGEGGGALPRARTDMDKAINNCDYLMALGAAEGGHQDLLTAMLTRMRDAEIPFPTERALLAAARHGRVDVCRALPPPKRWMALVDFARAAAGSGSLELCEYAVAVYDSRRGLWGDRAVRDEMALHSAIMQAGAAAGHVDLCRHVLQRVPGSGDLGFIIAATSSGSRELCEMARRNGATNFEEMLHAAAVDGHLELCLLAREWGVPPLNEDTLGELLSEAVISRNQKLVELFLQWGADDASAPVSDVMSQACMDGFSELIEFALARGEEVDYVVLRSAWPRPRRGGRWATA